MVAIRACVWMSELPRTFFSLYWLNWLYTWHCRSFRKIQEVFQATLALSRKSCSNDKPWRTVSMYISSHNFHNFWRRRKVIQLLCSYCNCYFLAFSFRPGVSIFTWSIKRIVFFCAFFLRPYMYCEIIGLFVSISAYYLVPLLEKREVQSKSSSNIWIHSAICN